MSTRPSSPMAPPPAHALSQIDLIEEQFHRGELTAYEVKMYVEQLWDEYWEDNSYGMQSNEF